MKFWCWDNGVPVELDADGTSGSRPVVFLFPGAFEVDYPEHIFPSQNIEVDQLFDILATLEGFEPQTLAAHLSRPLPEKLTTDSFVLRKLLGLASGSAESERYLTAYCDEAVEIIQLSYSSAGDTLLDLRQLGRDIAYFGRDAEQFVTRVFGKTLHEWCNEPDRIVSRFSSITLFGISYGSAFIIQIENALDRLMVSLAFGPSDRVRILRSLASVAVSNVSNVFQATGPRSFSVFFHGINDAVARCFISPPPALTEEVCAVLPISDAQMVVAANIPAAERWIETIPGIDCAALAENKALHYVPFYTMRSSSNFLLPGLAERVLRNLLRRVSGETMSLRHLFRYCAPFNPAVEGPPVREMAAIDDWISRMEKSHPLICGRHD